MPGAISEQDVRRLARLARLELTGAEARRFAGQLAEILDYADQVQQVETSAVSTADPAAAAAGRPREDTVRPGLSREDALANAPDADRDAGFFKVPRVLG